MGKPRPIQGRSLQGPIPMGKEDIFTNGPSTLIDHPPPIPSTVTSLLFTSHKQPISSNLSNSPPIVQASQTSLHMSSPQTPFHQSSSLPLATNPSAFPSPHTHLSSSPTPITNFPIAKPNPSDTNSSLPLPSSLSPLDYPHNILNPLNLTPIVDKINIPPIYHNKITL